MNQDQITGIIRAIVPPIVAWLAAKGVIGAESAGEIVTALTAIAVALWSIYIHMPDRTAAIALANDPVHIVKAVARLPEVKNIDIEPTVKGIKLAADVGSTPDAVVTIAKPPPTDPKDK